MSPSLDPTARRPGGRANQKERTRQALLAATRALIEEGQAPTIARAAERALISEATAYRYYSDARDLLRDALQWPGMDGLLSELRATPAVAARARRAAEAMAGTVLANEAQIRALIALSYTPGRSEKGAATRPALRVPLIDAVLEPVADRMDASERRRLRCALSAVIGAEAVLSLKDVGGFGDEEIVATLGWAAFQLAAAALGSPSAGEGARRGS
jgi:AcrR family transcriptional regulator